MKFLLWLFLVVPLHLSLVSPAPGHSPESKRSYAQLAKRQTATPLIVQANSWASDHTPAVHGSSEAPSNFVLPPVSEVFKFLADPDAPRPALPANPQQPIAHPPAPAAPANNNQPPGAHPPPVPPAAHGNNNPQPPPSHDNQPPLHPLAPPGPNQKPDPPHTEGESKNELTSGEKSVEDSSDPPSTSPENQRRKNLAPVGKLILIALVMAGIITLIFCIYFLVDRRALSCCCRRRRSRRNRAYRLDDDHEDQGHEKEMPPISYPKFVQSPTPQDQSYAFEASTIPPIVHPLHNHHHIYNHNQAADIAPGLPPASAMSRFPVTAKPYPFAAGGASFSSTSLPPVPAQAHNPPNSPVSSSPLSPAPRSPLPPPPPPQPIHVPPPIPGGLMSNPTPIHSTFRRARRSSTPAPLLPPNEFFFMPSTSEATVNLHARAKSNPYAPPHNYNKRASSNTQGHPIFGHIVARCLPEIKKMSLRSGEHRKSKSISGLVYVVDTQKGGGRRKNKGQGAGGAAVNEERYGNAGGTPPVAF